MLCGICDNQEMMVSNVTGGARIRESRHLQTRPTITGGSQGARLKEIVLSTAIFNIKNYTCTKSSLLFKKINDLSLPLILQFPGLFIVLPCIESYKKVDLRTITLGVPPQEVDSLLLVFARLISFTWQLLTKDSVTVSVDAVVYYRVSNAIVSVTNVKDTHHSTK